MEKRELRSKKRNIVALNINMEMIVLINVQVKQSVMRPIKIAIFLLVIIMNIIIMNKAIVQII